jgi:hypothetical protein
LYFNYWLGVSMVRSSLLLEMIKSKKLIRPDWIWTQSDLIFSESQTNSNSIWPESERPEMTRYQTTWSEPEQPETWDDPRLDNSKSDPIRTWMTRTPRWPEIKRPETRPDLNLNDPKFEMIRDQTTWNLLDLNPNIWNPRWPEIR